VATEQESVLAFLGEQKVRQSGLFPTVKHDKVLTFMATTSSPGSYGEVSLHRVVKLEAGPTPREMGIGLAGALPRAATQGECLTVHLTRPERYQGFQVKTRTLGGKVVPADLVEPAPHGQMLVKGAGVYTVHHSPYTLKFFENVPLQEVVETVGAVRYAMVCLGEGANISPRFVYHQELRDGTLALYHGDGLALKTYMNLRSNPQETRIVVDMETYRGFLLRGPVEEFAPHQHPEAYDRVCRGFTAGGWGKPSRVFRFTAQQIVPLDVVG
jgi:hypothetical protein